MKKFFTLISMALVAMSASAETIEELIAKGALFEVADVTWGDVTWKNGNNKKDKENNDMFFLMGTGNGYKSLYVEEIYTDGEATGNYRPYYTYIDYEKGETGLPGYGLYYKFSPSTSGKLKVCVWVNKGNRKTFVVKASTGKPLTPYVDYTFEGYVNGQNEDGHPKFLTADEIKARHDDYDAEQQGKGKDPMSPYVIDCGTQAVWGWICFDVEMGESYIIYQQSSQLGFGGFEYTPNGMPVETFVGSPAGGLPDEFAAKVNSDGVAQNVENGNSTINFNTSNMAVTAVGSSTPTDVVPGAKITEVPTIINTVKEAVNVNAPIYNLAGQKVSKNSKGVLIQNGKKVVKK